MNPTKESSWTVKQLGPTEVVVEGVRGDIPQIVNDILNPESKLGKIARSSVWKLKTRGFSLLVLRDEFAKRMQGSIDEFFPIQASFNIEKKHYVVEFSDRPQFKAGQVLE